MNLSELHLFWRGGSYKNKRYRSYSLAKAYRAGGKNRRKIVCKLGKLSEREVEWWRKLLITLKKPSSFVTTTEDIVTRKHFAYLDLAVINEIWNYWKLDNVFPASGKRLVPLPSVARILTLNRCVNPLSKSKVADWFPNTFLPWELDVDPEQFYPTRIFRELLAIENSKEQLCEHLFKMIGQHFPGSMKNVFYDLSSTTFTGTKCLLAKYGHCKEGFKTHVVLALLVNRDGLPFYWEVLPGGTADAKTVEWLLERCRRKFKINGVTIVFDRGMVSDENLTMIENDEIKYISAMDKNQIENICDMDFNKYSYFDSGKIHEQIENLKHFSKMDNQTYYREIKTEKKRRYILCFNPQLFIDQRNGRKEALENFKDIVVSINDELEYAKNSRKHDSTLKKFETEAAKLKINKFINISLEETTVKSSVDNSRPGKIRSYKGSFTVDEKAMLISGRLDGFWLLVTNHTEKNNSDFSLSSVAALQPYRDKVVIEDAFRNIKSFVEVNPVSVWTPVHVKAHYSICVLAYLINKTISLRLKRRKGTGSQKIISHQSCYDALKECTIDRFRVNNVQEDGVCMTELNTIQKELLKRLELTKVSKAENVIKKLKNSLKMEFA